MTSAAWDCKPKKDSESTRLAVFCNLESCTTIVIEDGGIGGDGLVVEPYGRVVHLGVLGLKEIKHLGTCPENGAVAVGGHDMDRAIGIERGIEAHACANTNILYLTFRVDRRGNSMPSQLGYRTIDLGIYPTAIDGVGEAIGIDGSGRRLEIGVRTVEKLMPETIVMLKGGKALEV